MPDALPIFGICGFSGAGKTTLLEEIVPKLTGRGLRVVVVKHDVHGLSQDAAGKDSDRLFRVGADVVVGGPAEWLVRRGRQDEPPLDVALADLAQHYDLVLLEGFKRHPCRKVWLLQRDEVSPPEDIDHIEASLPWNGDRAIALAEVLDRFLSETLRQSPLRACVLVGGRSTRMGQPKHLLPSRHNPRRTWLHDTLETCSRLCPTTLLVGEGEIPPDLGDIPRLPDVADASGPMAGLLAAMRWSPRANWLLVACDMPWLSVDAITWLLDQRAPGVWAVLPKRPNSRRVEPLLAWYDARFRAALERQAASDRGCDSLQPLSAHPKAHVATIPAALSAAWHDADTPEAAASSIPPPG